MIRVTTLAAAFAAVACTAAALADLPPPADDYIGPKHVTLAGLNFEHRVSHYSRELRLHRTDSYVLLVGCEGSSENCNRVERAGVIDWRVISVDGKPVPNGDLQAVIDAFASGRGPVDVLFVQPVPSQPPRTFALQLDRK